jgi:beta-galactosidase
MKALRDLPTQTCILLVCVLATVSLMAGAQASLLASAATGTVVLRSEAPADQRAKYNFNFGWKLFVGDRADAQAPAFDDTDWNDVTLPRAWNEDDAFKKDIKDLSTGVVWYRKHFKLPANSAGRKVFLEFEGIRHAGEFYVNGKLAGRHENGVMAFGFDITDLVRATPEDNVVAARIDNSWDYREKASGSTYEWNDRNFYANYGGINKNVFLHITGKLHQTLPLYSNLGTTGVYVYAQDFDFPSRSATITAQAEVKNEYPTAQTFQYEVVIEDADHRRVKSIDGGQFTCTAGEIKTVSAKFRANGLNFWSWGYGYLYHVHTILKVAGRVVDDVTTPTGFRKTEFANGTFRLNDRVLHLKGYGQRTTNEWPALGSAVPAWLSEFSDRMMLESNANLVRWMHVTPWKQDIESCDRLGLMEAMPAGDAEKDVEGRRWEQRVELMRDAIIYNRNNPSIVFYESGNKGISEDHMRQMRAVRDQYDPHGGRAIGAREMLNSTVAEYGGEMLYINKSAHIPMWAMEYSRDEGLRKYWDDYSPPFHKDGAGPLYDGQAASVYNHNQDSHAIEDVTRWYDYWRERPGTGARVNAGGVNIIFSDSNTHHRGAENYRRSGEVDAARLPKDGYFAHQVMWDGWVDIENPPRIHIIGHWNYAPGTKKNVYVVSSAEKIELLVNGVSWGFGAQTSRFLFTFKDVAWQPGIIIAVGYDAAGREIGVDTKHTAGDPSAIRLTVRTGPSGLRADGADVALVDVEIIDAKGQRCPTALNMINFSLSGPAEWRGGIAQGPDNYILAESLPVENGVNRVIIRSMPQAGKIVLSATTDGLKPASIAIVSRPVTVTDGMSLELPDAGLISYLTRGPTPAATPLKRTREPVLIASASAGVKMEQASQSFDDDETTAWTSDGQLAHGWIRYEFAPARVSEVTLKLANWRTRSYPLRITVDDKVVYTGETPRSLGYVTISFPPVVGHSLKIELTGPPKDLDPFGQIIEVTGQKNRETAGDRGTLAIVEVEIYEPRR